MMCTFIKGVPGLLLVGILATLTILLSQYVSLSATLIAILLGFIVGNSLQLSALFRLGIGWFESHGLAAAVALLGVQLNLSVLMQINPLSLPLIAAAILLTFMLTFLLAKLLRTSNTESCLLASGQGICGSAAVMAASKALNETNKATTGLIIAVVNFLGFLGVFITPWLVQHVFKFNDIASGFLIGNTLQSMGHVVAAGFSVNDAVGNGAVLIKMCRILFLIPALLLIIFLQGRTVYTTEIHGDNAEASKPDWLKLIPWFIWAFLALIVLNNLGWIAPNIQGILTQTGDVLFILAMVAIGLGIRIKAIWQQGVKLLVLGGLVFMLQIVFTLLVLNFI